LDTTVINIPFEAAPGEELFLIGDIHGRSDLLDFLLDEASGTAKAGESRTLVFLGDLIDRGPDSLGCLDRAIGSKDRVGADNVVGLVGNHEQMLMVALANGGTDRGQNALDTWMWNGGKQVVAELKGETSQDGIDLVETLGDVRISWLSDLTSHYVSGRILAVHGGVNPKSPIRDFLSRPWNVDFRHFEESEHWAWVRRPFLAHVPEEDEGHGGYFVVHGHTAPHYEGANLSEQIRRSRLNLDGGSYSTGKARMARICGGKVTLFET